MRPDLAVSAQQVVPLAGLAHQLANLQKNCGTVGCVARRSMVRYTGLSGPVARTMSERERIREAQRRIDAVSLVRQIDGWLAICECGWTGVHSARRLEAAREGRTHTKHPCGGAQTAQPAEPRARRPAIAAPLPPADPLDLFVVRQFERKWCWQCERCGTAGGWSEGERAQQRAEFDTFNHRCDV